jgi:hypothetical protein
MFEVAPPLPRELLRLVRVAVELEQTSEIGQMEDDEERSIDLYLCDEDYCHPLWDLKWRQKSAGRGRLVEFVSARYRPDGIPDPAWKPPLDWRRVMPWGRPLEAQALLAVGENRMVEDKIGDELCVAAWTLAGSKVAELRAAGFEGSPHDLRFLLRLAAAANSVEAIELLLAVGTEVNAAEFNWDPHGGPLHTAAEWNSAAAAAELIAAGAHVNRGQGSAWLETPLAVARRHNSARSGGAAEGRRGRQS